MRLPGCKWSHQSMSLSSARMNWMLLSVSIVLVGLAGASYAFSIAWTTNNRAHRFLLVRGKVFYVHYSWSGIRPPGYVVLPRSGWRVDSAYSTYSPRSGKSWYHVKVMGLWPVASFFAFVAGAAWLRFYCAKTHRCTCQKCGYDLAPPPARKRGHH